jgi:hypothetical protein
MKQVLENLEMMMMVMVQYMDVYSLLFVRWLLVVSKLIKYLDNIITEISITIFLLMY